MSGRAVSDALKEQLFKPWRDRSVKVLLTVSHATFPQPYRLVSDVDPLTHLGNEYIALPFDITLPGDDDEDPTAQITIQNADDRLGQAVLALPDEAVTINLKVVMRETPDVVEVEFDDFELVDVEVTAISIAGRIVVRGLSTEPWPSDVLSATLSPVFFR